MDIGDIIEKDIRELSAEELGAVSGGTMTDRAETVLNALITALKKDTSVQRTPEEAISFVTSRLMDNANLAGVTEKEVEDYVRAHWN